VELLVVSNVVLGIGFLILVVVNLALARQVGVLYERIAPAGALMMNQTLTVGERAPELAVPTLQGGIEDVGKVVDDKSQLLFFLSPDCPVCNELVPALKSAARAEKHWLRVVLASDGANQDHLGYVARKGMEAFPYVVSELLGKTYGVSKLPYAVVIDEQGMIASMGIVNSREHLDSLFEAKERKVASIQEYMSRREPVQYEEADKA
jgi:methylamine dehydrogenase accessory protein MauD